MDFMPFLCLTALARASSTMLNRSGESKHPLFFLILEEKLYTFHFSPLSMMLAVGLSQMAFLTWRYIPSILNLLRIFIMKKVEFVHFFFCVYCDDHMIFILHFVKMVYHVY